MNNRDKMNFLQQIVSRLKIKFWHIFYCEKNDKSKWFSNLSQIILLQQVQIEIAPELWRNCFEFFPPRTAKSLLKVGKITLEHDTSQMS